MISAYLKCVSGMLKKSKLRTAGTLATLLVSARAGLVAAQNVNSTTAVLSLLLGWYFQVLTAFKADSANTGAGSNSPVAITPVS